MERASPDSPLLGLLAWYRTMGADDLVADDPTDWMARGDRAPGQDIMARAAAPSTARIPVTTEPRRAPAAARQAAGAAEQRPQSRQFATASPDEAVMSARRLAAEASTIEQLGALLQRFEGCGLKATAKSLCHYRGAPRARLMLIGEAPGREEDLTGRPFVGPAGQLLDKMLQSIGLGEADVHITNIVFWRPPGNRAPTPQEAQACRPFLARQIELVAPEMLVTLGGPATKHICDVADGIMKLRGKWLSYAGADRTLRVLPTLHPAYLLRTPAAKRQTWRDLLAIEAALANA